MTEEDFKNLAQQLSRPEGKNGIKTGENMKLTNFNMIQSTIDTMVPLRKKYLRSVRETATTWKPC